MILDLDVGNSRLKWRLTHRGRVLVRGLTEHVDGWCDHMAVQIAAQNANAGPLERIRIASVGSLQVNAALELGCRQHLGINPEFARSQPFLAGVANGYSQPELLGVDRWMALVAAYHRLAVSCVVVDAGSAITVDLVDANGRHQGGYIAPGLIMMRSGLSATAGVRVGASQSPLLVSPGQNTTAAVDNALAAMICGLIDEAIRQITLLEGASPVLVVTGGDAEYLLTHYPSAHYWPELVLDGLDLALPVS